MATTTAGPSCVEVWLEEEQDTWDANPMAVGIAFAVALIVGGLIAFGCAKLCMKDFIKRKTQHAEYGYMEENNIAVHQKQKLIETQSSNPKTRRRKRMKGRNKLRGGSAQGDGAEKVLLEISPIVLDGDNDRDGKKGLGLLDALIKDSGAEMENELADQDLIAVNKLEREFREQNIDTMLQCLRTLLNKFLKAGKLTPEQAQELIQNSQNNLDHMINSLNQNKELELVDLRKKIKDPEKLEGEIDNINSKYDRKMASLLQQEKEHLRQDIMKVTDLSDDEIDALLSELTRNMADLENQLGMERMRQAASLEDRLAKRRLLAQQQRDEQQQQQEEIRYRTQSHGATLGLLVDDGKMLDRQKEELLSQYNNDLIKMQKKHEEEFQKQKLSLAEKLRQRRETQTNKLTERHEKQKAQFVGGSDKMVDTGDLVSSYHELFQQQRQEADDLNDELDTKEADEIRKLSRGIEKDRNVEIQQREEQFEDEIRTKAQLSDMELNRILARHQQHMEDFNAQKKLEKKRMTAMMEEKLHNRRQQVQDEQRLALSEQAVFREQQDATIEKVLQSQVELTKIDKEQIMKEHEQNMSVMTNQLQMSKLKQQKQLEAKLNKRRARVEDMKNQAQEVQMSQKKDKEKQMAQLEKQIAEEEDRIEDDRKKALAEASERMARETREALSDQEKQIGQLLARLQVGQARRQALIQRQDRTIKDLEDKLSTRVADKVEESGDHDDASHQVDHILQQHMNQVSNLTDRLQDVKDRQNNIIQDKLQQKKIKKEREIENKLEYEAQEDFQDKQRRGTLGKASQLLGQFMLDTRHKTAMNQLEREMQAEMTKQREELNAELEAELQAELEEQKKNFLSQLAAISDLSKDEMNELVTSAVVDTGGDSEQAKQLSKDMRIGLKRAKSELHVDGRPMTAGKKKKASRPRDDDDDEYRDGNRGYDQRRDSQRGYDNHQYDDRGDYDDYDNSRSHGNRNYDDNDYDY